MKILDKLSKKNADISGGAPVTIAFLGDSVTQGCFELTKGYGCDFDGAYDYDAVYHFQLKKMLNYVFPASPINIINAGIGGNIAQQGCDRIERDIFPYSPDLVVICFGLNDVCFGIESLDKFISALKVIFDKLRERDIETIFMTPNMLNTYPSPLTVPDSVMDFASKTAGIQNDGVMDVYMGAVQRLCAVESIPVCDCYEKWKKLHKAGVNTTKLLSNHINHPSREMHMLFSISLFEMIVFG
jgi:Lysophospholipase L1 and related esterases